MKLEDHLPTALDNIANTTPVGDPGDFNPHLATASTSTNRSSKRLLASAAAIGALGIGGLVIASGRETPAPVSESVPDPAPPTVTLPPAPATEPGPDGALLLPEATGMNVAYIEQGALAGDLAISWYATPTAQPETSTYLRVVAYDVGLAAGDVAECFMDGATVSSALVDGTPVCLEDRDPADPTGAIAINVDQFAVIVDGRATDEQLVAAAENLATGAQPGAFEISPDGLPPQVENLATGFGVSDFATVAAAQADDDMITANFVDDQARSIFYLATRRTSPALDTYRLGFGSVTDILVRGESGFIRTLDDEPNYLGLVWQEDGVTYQVGSQGLTQDELLALVEQLQPATQSDWEAAIAAIPDVTQGEEEAATTTILIDE